MCDPSLTRAILSALVVSSHEKALYKCPVFNFVINPNSSLIESPIRCSWGQISSESMQYDPIQGQGQGHEPFKVGNAVIFNSYLLRHLQW